MGDVQVWLVVGAVLALSSRDSNIWPQTVCSRGRKRRCIFQLEGERVEKERKREYYTHGCG